MPLSRVPSSFTGTTRLASPAANTVAITTSSAERLRIDSSGYLLVGTTSASSLYSGAFTISMNTMVAQGGFDALGLFDAGGNPSINFLANNSASNRYRAAAIRGFLTTTTAGSEASALAFYTVSGGSNISERMRIDSNGNVGIGVSSVFSPGGSRRGLIISNSTNGAILGLGSGTESNIPRIFSGEFNLGFAAGPSTGILEFYTDNLERMRLTSAGNLLVGTTSDTGSTSNSSRVVSGQFVTNNGSAINTTINVAADLFTLPSNYGTILLTVKLNGVGSPADADSVAIISVNAGSASQTNLKAGSWVVISLNGLTVRATQNQFTGANISWAAIRIS
jgi:hypothetical protein